MVDGEETNVIEMTPALEQIANKLRKDRRGNYIILKAMTGEDVEHAEFYKNLLI